MVKVRILTMRSGPGVSLSRGQVIECTDQQAKQLIEADAGELVEVESAMLKPTEGRADAGELDTKTNSGADRGASDTGRAKAARKNRKR